MFRRSRVNLTILTPFSFAAYKKICTFATRYGKEKLIERLKRLPKDFTYAEAVTLLEACGFEENNKGGTSGYRVMFKHPDVAQALMFHKPHPQKELKPYVVKMIYN